MVVNGNTDMFLFPLIHRVLGFVIARLSERIEELKDIARKWRRVWESKRIYEANAEPGRPKFFVTAAFMYPNGPAHIGHARTYLIPDILARYKRARGFNVLFPMGFHYTGTPILVEAERISSGEAEYIKKVSESTGVDEEVLRRLTDPLRLARFFHEASKEAMKDYGLSIDWRREFTSIDEEFKSFIRWQFEVLRSKGFITKGTHPVGWCPRHQMPVGMHDTKDDVEPEIDEFTVIKFRGSDGLIYPTATLRPETTLGVTNLWVNPEAEYCVSLVNGELWVLGCEAAERLKYQKSVTIKERIKGSDLVGRYVENPLTGKLVKIIPATFVSPKYGTGVVMSVPAHAPYDYVALADFTGSWNHELWGEFRPIPLIIIKEYGEVPAASVVKSLDIKSQRDSKLLDEATRVIYRSELEKGVMRHDVVNLIKDSKRDAKLFIAAKVAGTSVRDARDRIRSYLVMRGEADTIFEVVNAPVFCRCGSEIVVKLLGNQWFIDYGNPEWKELAKEALLRMRVVPSEAKNQFLATIDWLRAKACARTRGLGTELPWEKGWVIESLSDSTIYMAYYTVANVIRTYGIPSSKLTKEFWDYVMLGIGDPSELSAKLSIPVDALKRAREEFSYWYPLDSRHSGKDLIPNHLTFFIFNHVAVFPRDKWPKQIVANGWVLVSGMKMSKSKGNIRTLRGLIDLYSPDAVRLALSVEAEVEQDLNFSEDRALSAVEKLGDVEKTIEMLSTIELGSGVDLPERWLLSRLATNTLRVYEDLDNVRIRSAGVRVFYVMHQDLKKYLALVKRPSKVVRRYIDVWLKLISIFTPFIAEEIWHRLGNESLIASELLPEVEELKEFIDYEVELALDYVDKVVSDVRSIMRVIKGKEAVIYVAPEYMYEHLVDVLKVIKAGGRLPEVIEYMVKKNLGLSKGEVVKYAKRLFEVATSLNSDVVDKLLRAGRVNELNVLSRFKSYIELQTGIKIVNVYRSDEEVPDYGKRKGQALPWRPSIFIFREST